MRATRGPPGMIQSSRTGSDTVMFIPDPSRRRRTGPGGLYGVRETRSGIDRNLQRPEAVK